MKTYGANKIHHESLGKRSLCLPLVIIRESNMSGFSLRQLRIQTLDIFFFWTFTPFSYFKELFSSSRILNVKATDSFSQKKKTGAGKTCPTRPLVWGVNVSPP